MTRAVVFRRAAQSEFIDAAGWYEAQRSGLGEAFVAEVERCTELAAEQPHCYAVVHGGTRMVTTRRFPYNMYFQAEPQRIVVLAVFHASRDPSVWLHRQ